MGIGKSVKRQDAHSKVTGTAKYVDDLLPLGALAAVVLHSTIAHGTVLSIDCDEAKKIPGVIHILTCFDVPDLYHSTAGHPLSLNVEHADIPDRKMLDSRILHYGDSIAVVVAQDALTAEKAISAIHVEYGEEPLLLSPRQAENAKAMHPECFDSNVFASFGFAIQNGELKDIGPGCMSRHIEAAIKSAYENEVDADLEETFSLPAVHACHIETPQCYAYMEGSRITVVTATQDPHTVCRVVSEAIDYPISQIRVVKPYVGGSFGNKQDIFYETLAAYLTKKLGGRCVGFNMSREESFINSRTRHAMEIKLRSVYGDSRIKVRCAELDSEQGAYAAHGHAITINAATDYAYMYESNWCIAESRSTYTNKPAGGAMRGYGIPQIAFAMEAHTDDLALKLGIDPLELRKKTMVRDGYTDPINGNVIRSYGLPECIEKGAELIGYQKKRREYSDTNTGNLRRGVGMAMFIYPTGLAPFALESSACRIVLTLDGGLSVQVGATELGQGADTVLGQIASEVLKVPDELTHTISTQDTDVTPYDNGAYASRQTFVAGSAVKRTAEILRDKMLAFTARHFSVDQSGLELNERGVCNKETGKLLFTHSEVAKHSQFNIEESCQLVAESTFCMRDNAFSFGTCYADIEVDMALGKIKVNRLALVHDSGTIINPQLAEAQVHGGAVMGLGYALTEQLLYDEKTGRMHNNNLLDYKIPTSMDIPQIDVAFVNTYEPKGPVGNKSLGEPPIIAVAPAIRNALLHATGISVNTLPLTPERLLQAFCKTGLVKERDQIV